MTVDSNLVPINPEDSFLLAVAQLEAGVALEIVLSSFPVEERADLRELLTVVAATHHLQEIDIPRPAPEERAASKRAFLQVATAMKQATAAERVTMAASAPAQASTDSRAGAAAPLSNSRAATSRSVVPTTTLGSRLATWWADLVSNLAPTGLRLAPLIAMLAAIWLGAFSAVNVAQAAIPGQAAYAAKTWIFAQKLTLSAEKDRTEIYTDFTKQLETDNALAGELAAKENKIVPSQVDLIIDNIGRTHIEMGGQLYELSYRKSLDSNEMLPTKIVGLPAEGAQAHIEYQIVPDPNGPPGATVLQGISITIEEEPLVIPTAVPTTVESTAPVVTNRSCSNEIPTGWVAYRVPAGVTLSGISQQTGASVVTLTRVNCITNPNNIRAGEVIMVPRVPVVITTPVMPTATTPGLAVTLTGISPTQTTPLITVTLPAEGTPTVAITPTLELTPAGTMTPVVVITATVVATTTTPVATPEPSVTISITATTVAPSITPTTTVVMPISTPIATSVVSATLETTPETTAEAVDPAGEGTPVPPLPTATPTPPTVAATSEATAVVTAVVTEIATATVAETPIATERADEPSDGGADEVGGASNGGGDGATEAVGTPPAEEATPAPLATTIPEQVSTVAVAAPTTIPTTNATAEGRTGSGNSGGGNSGDSRSGPLLTATPTAVNSSPLESGR